MKTNKLKKLVAIGVLLAMSTGAVACNKKTDAVDEPKTEPNKDNQSTPNTDANQEGFTEEKGEQEAINNGSATNVTGKYCSYLLVSYDEAKDGTVSDLGGSVLNVRVEPSLTAKVVDRLYEGAKVKVIGKAGDWYQIAVEGTDETRFVHSNYVKVVGLPYNHTHSIEVEHNDAVVDKKPSNGGYIQSKPTTSGGNKPSNPSQPSKPSQPSQPSKPVKPVEPSKPVKPSTPAETINAVPVITGNDLVITGLNTEFDLAMLELKAMDTEDGNLTEAIRVISNNVDTSKAGNYEVKVEVADSKGAKTTLVLKVEVRAEEKPQVPAEGLNAVPTITGINVSMVQGGIFDISSLGIIAKDFEDGDLEYEVIKNEVNVAKAGNYKVIVKATDKQGASCTKTFTVTVLPKDQTVIPGQTINAVPVINVRNHQVNLKVNDKWSLDLHDVTATDNEDGNIKDIKVNGTVDTTTPGTKFVEISVTDSKGATAKTTLTVVVALESPEMNLAPKMTVEHEEVTVVQGKSWNIDMHGVEIFDGEDGFLEVKVKGSVDTSKLGTQHVVVYATDSKGAKVERQLTIKIVEPKNSAPIITADRVVIKQGQKYDVSMHNAKATDAEEGTLTDRITYTTNVDTSMSGIYQTTFTVKDSQGLSASITVEVQVLAVAPTIVSKDVVEVKQYTEGFTFKDLGITAHDASGRDLTSRIEVTGFDKIDFKVAKDYPIDLKVIDFQGMVSNKTIIVRVTPVEGAMSPMSAEFNKVLVDEINRLMNEYRVSKGRTAIPVKAIAVECAEVKINHMVENKYFDHTYEGKFIWDIYEKYMDAFITGENLQLTTVDVSKKYTMEEAKYYALTLFNNWKESATHNAMMLSDWNTGFGLAIKVFENGKVMAVQEFMSEY